MNTLVILACAVAASLCYSVPSRNSYVRPPASNNEKSLSVIIKKKPWNSPCSSSCAACIECNARCPPSCYPNCCPKPSPQYPVSPTSYVTAPPTAPPCCKPTEVTPAPGNNGYVVVPTCVPCTPAPTDAPTTPITTTTTTQSPCTVTSTTTTKAPCSAVTTTQPTTATTTQPTTTTTQQVTTTTPGCSCKSTPATTTTTPRSCNCVTEKPKCGGECNCNRCKEDCESKQNNCNCKSCIIYRPTVIVTQPEPTCFVDIKDVRTTISVYCECQSEQGVYVNDAITRCSAVDISVAEYTQISLFATGTYACSQLFTSYYSIKQYIIQQCSIYGKTTQPAVITEYPVAPVTPRQSPTTALVPTIAPVTEKPKPCGGDCNCNRCNNQCAIEENCNCKSCIIFRPTVIVTQPETTCFVDIKDVRTTISVYCGCKSDQGTNVIDAITRCNAFDISVANFRQISIFATGTYACNQIFARISRIEQYIIRQCSLVQPTQPAVVPGYQVVPVSPGQHPTTDLVPTFAPAVDSYIVETTTSSSSSVVSWAAISASMFALLVAFVTVV